jgi:hypothetical protein
MVSGRCVRHVDILVKLLYRHHSSKSDFKSSRQRVFWDVAPCNPAEIDRRFVGAYCLHHQGDTLTLKSQVMFANIIMDYKTKYFSASYGTLSILHRIK